MVAIGFPSDHKESYRRVGGRVVGTFGLQMITCAESPVFRGVSNDCSGKVPIFREPLFAVAGAEFQNDANQVYSPRRSSCARRYQPTPDDLLQNPACRAFAMTRDSSWDLNTAPAPAGAFRAPPLTR